MSMSKKPEIHAGSHSKSLHNSSADPLKLELPNQFCFQDGPQRTTKPKPRSPTKLSLQKRGELKSESAEKAQKPQNVSGRKPQKNGDLMHWFRSSERFKNLMIFQHLLVAIQNFFIGGSAEGYQQCGHLGKQLFKLVLATYFSEDELGSFEVTKDSHEPLSAETVQALAQLIGFAQKDAIQSDLVESFFEFRVREVERKLNPVIGLTAEQRLLVRVEFLYKFFPQKSESPEDKVRLVSAFVKLDPNDPIHNKYFDKSLIESHRKCYTHEHRMRLIESEPVMVFSLVEFLSLKENSRVVRWLETKNRNRAKYIVDCLLRNSRKHSRLSRADRLRDYEQVLRQNRHKLPVQMSLVEDQAFELLLGLNMPSE